MPFLGSRIILGSADFGNRVADPFPVLDRFYELGGRSVDTAFSYAAWIDGQHGVPERLIGDWLRDRKVQLSIATKGGTPGYETLAPEVTGFLDVRTLRVQIETSLERMGVSSVDLWYLHRDDGITPVEEVIDGINEFVSAGWTKALGASNWRKERIDAANAYAKQAGKVGFSVVQPQWSLGVPTWNMGEDPTLRYVTPDDAAFYANEELLVAVYSATSNGFFATDGFPKNAFNSDDNRALLAKVKSLANEFGVTPTQVALQWLLQQPCHVWPILSTGNLAHLEEAFGALDVEIPKERVLSLRSG